MTKEEFNAKADFIYNKYKDAPLKEINRLPWPYNEYIIKRKAGQLKRIHQ